MDIDPERRKKPQLAATETETSQLRAVNGAAQRRSTQTGPQFASAVSLSQSRVNAATVQDLLTANKIIKDMKGARDQEIRIHAFPPGTELVSIFWHDAALANRPDYTSTGGYIGGLAPKSILEGKKA